MNTYEPFAFGRALAASGLTTKAKIAGHSLAVYADGKTGYCYPTQEQLAEASSQSVPTVTRALAELVAAGFVTVARNERKNYNRNNVYWLRVPSGTRSLAVAIDEQPASEPEPKLPKVAKPIIPPKVPEPAKVPPPAEPSMGGFPSAPVWRRDQAINPNL